MTGARTETRDHGRACMLGASRFEKKHNAHKAAWFTTATVIGAISAFVDSIDSHIILRMIRESKMTRSHKWPLASHKLDY